MHAPRRVRRPLSPSLSPSLFPSLSRLLRACAAAVTFTVTFTVTFAAACNAAHAAPADATLARAVNAFVDGWHDDAAHARMAYFDKIAPDGVFIGTDRSELWRRDAFLAWGRKYFEGRSKAWAYRATRRNVYASGDGGTVWFDELLDDDKQAHFMASGVLRRTAAGFLVEHYQLSIAVPNEVADQVIEATKSAESNTP